MPFSIDTISAVRDELNSCITGMRIDKVQQPQGDMIILTLRGRSGGLNKLLICVSVGDMRVHLTEHIFENPASPPMFCMLLRKYLIGARIESISQPPSERMLEFTLKSSTAMGDAKELRLVLELFGRIPNIILIDNEGIIMDCMRRIGGDLNSDKRMLLPGLRYHAPEPLQGNLQREPSQEQTQTQADKLKNYGGSISKMLDETYTHRAKLGNMSRRCAALRKTMNSARKRTVRRLEAQRNELDVSGKREHLRESADIIMANMHQIKKGDTLLVADDFYAEGDGVTREIELDGQKSPQKNAEKYYKAYTKAKNAQEHLTRQIALGEAELTYIESVLDQLTRVESEQELMDIHEELEQTKYIKQRAGKFSKSVKKPKKVEAKPLQFRSSTGMVIYAGKNNLQNERLTLRSAHKSDIWLHAQKIHGAHVVIKTDRGDVDDVSLKEAATIAAYYSAARDAAKVPVDYTPVKYVKKQPGGHPGMVIYTDFKTIIVTPKSPEACLPQP